MPKEGKKEDKKQKASTKKVKPQPQSDPISSKDIELKGLLPQDGLPLSDAKDDPKGSKNDKKNAQDRADKRKLKQKIKQSITGDADDEKFKELLKETDDNGRNLIHKAALDCNEPTLNDNLLQFTTEQVETLITTEDHYGNTPLFLACIDSEDVEDQVKCIKLLMGLGSNPNVFNRLTRMTPLHWLAAHGHLESIKLLIEDKNNPAEIAIPNNQGRFPIDYAGFGGHQETVKYLLDQTQLKLNFIVQNLTTSIKRNKLNFRLLKLGRPDFYFKSPVSDAILVSPIFLTSCLYWAAHFRDFGDTEIKQILDLKLEAYPEGPTIVEKFRTPVHAAAKVGNRSGLQLLCKHIYTRYIDQSHTENCIVPSKIFIQYEDYWKQVIRTNKALRQFENQTFKAKMKEYEKQNYNFKFVMFDEYLNTPLHLSSQNGHAHCTQILVKEYNCQIDVRNYHKLQPKQITFYPEVRDIYEQFFAELDEKILKKAAIQKSGGQDSQFEQELEDTHFPDSHIVKEPDQIHRLYRARHEMPSTGEYVIVVSAHDQQHRDKVNSFVKSLCNQNLIVQMFPTVAVDLRSQKCNYFLVLSMEQEHIEQEADKMNYMMELVDVKGKLDYKVQMKNKFTNFRSKDIQQIILKILQQTNFKNLITAKVILQHFPMHDSMELHDLEYTFQQRSLRERLSFYKEGTNCHLLDVFKNYFGEKFTFFCAYQLFTTSYLLMPAIPGIALTIQNNQSGNFVSKYNVWYCVLICFWVTIHIEFWKRKASEICFNWSIFDTIGENKRQIRDEFYGNEDFILETQSLTQHRASNKGQIFLIMNIPIQIGLLALVIAEYTFVMTLSKQTTDTNVQLIYSIINAVAVMLINFTYEEVAVRFTILQNCKYDSVFEANLAFKIFVFKVVATNLSLVFTALDGESDFQDLYSLLLGMVISKSVQIIVAKIIVPSLSFYLKKKAYFKHVSRLGHKQQESHEKCHATMKKSQQESIKKLKQKKSELMIYDDIDTKKDKPYQRIVMKAKKEQGESWEPDHGMIDEEHRFTDYVELNSRMTPKDQVQQYRDLSEDFLMYMLATMYATACPVASFVMLIHNIIEIKILPKIQYSFIQRSICDNDYNIGPWLKIAEILSISAVVSNCLLLINYRVQFQITFEDFLSRYDQVVEEVLFIQNITDYISVLNTTSTNSTLDVAYLDTEDDEEVDIDVSVEDLDDDETTQVDDDNSESQDQNEAQDESESQDQSQDQDQTNVQDQTSQDDSASTSQEDDQQEDIDSSEQQEDTSSNDGQDQASQEDDQSQENSQDATQDQTEDQTDNQATNDQATEDQATEDQATQDQATEDQATEDQVSQDQNDEQSQDSTQDQATEDQSQDDTSIDQDSQSQTDSIDDTQTNTDQTSQTDSGDTSQTDSEDTSQTQDNTQTQTDSQAQTDQESTEDPSTRMRRRMNSATSTLTEEELEQLETVGQEEQDLNAMLLQIVHYVSFFVFVLFIEHMLIFMKVILMVVIKDVPENVIRQYDAVKEYLRELNLESVEIVKSREREEENKVLNDGHQEEIDKMHEQIEQLEKKAKKLEREKEQLLSRKVTAQKLNEDDKLSIYQRVRKEIESEVVEGHLTDFLGIKKSEVLSKDRRVEIERTLENNLENRLFLEKFNEIERAVLNQRLVKLFHTKKSIMINCSECNIKLAEVECQQCNDHYCLECSQNLHKQAQVLQSHKIFNIDLSVQKVIVADQDQEGPIPDKSQDQKSTKKIKYVNDPKLLKTARWKKFEYFNLPVVNGNDHFKYIQMQFSYYQAQYITLNYIQNQGGINYPNFLIDRQYHVLTDEKKQIELMNSDKLLTDLEESTNSNLQFFNDEELLFMNRVAYYNFIQYGSELNFPMFLKSLQILQQGSFEEKLELWVNSMQDRPNSKTVSKRTFEEQIQASFLQDINGAKTVKEVLNLVYKPDQKKMSVQELVQLIGEVPEAKQLMTCLLQAQEHI